MREHAAQISWHVIKDVLGEIGSLRGRGVFALIGIAMGTAAVIAMLHIGHNARTAALLQFETMGSDLVMILPQQSNNRPAAVPIEAVRALPAQGLGVVQAAAMIQTGSTLRVGRDPIQVNVLAVSDAIYKLGQAELVGGRYTSDLDRFAPFAVLGAGVAADLMRVQGRPVEIGQTIDVGGNVLTIVGVLADTPISIILSIDFNGAILVPFEAARRVAPEGTINFIAARLSPDTDDGAAAKALKLYFDALMSSGSVHVQTARQMIMSIEEQMRIYALLLVGIGTVSLLVGGVGIMNVMLMSVMERRQEIGLRQAVGARRSDIRLMFLAETVALSLAGSALGTVIGYIGGWIFAQSSGWTFDPSPLALPLGAGMALVVGLFFGIYPANRAAKLDPIAALRSE